MVVSDMSIRITGTGEELRYRCGINRDGGRDWEPYGCDHRTPRDASKHVDRITERQRETRS